MCFMSTVTRKTDAFTAKRCIATREAGAQAVTNERKLNTVQRDSRCTTALKAVRDNSTHDDVESRATHTCKLSDGKSCPSDLAHGCEITLCGSNFNS